MIRILSVAMAALTLCACHSVPPTADQVFDKAMCAQLGPDGRADPIACPTYQAK